MVNRRPYRAKGHSRMIAALNFVNIAPSEDDFYKTLRPITHLRQMADLSHYRDVPAAWIVAVSDVRGSTEALDAGQYKDINSIAAAMIAALLNCAPDRSLPFVFGGDGAIVVLPSQYRAAAEAALVGVRDRAREAFDLDLRVGLVPVASIVQAGYSLKVARWQVSENYSQAVFTGGGLEYAEDLLKQQGTMYGIRDDVQPQADFSGFECRWNTIPAQHGEVVSLLVKSTAPTIEQRHAQYLEMLNTLDVIYGPASERRPIHPRDMTVAPDPRSYRREVSFKPGRGPRWWRALILFGWAVLGYVLWRFVSRIWARYKEVVVAATDHEKFDDLLRLTISGTPEQRRVLAFYLQDKHDAGELVYGLHAGQRSVMTCIVFDRFGQQVHFIDGEGGGYAQAAKQFKAQLKARGD